MPVTLTKLESEILIHRLDVPDCIAEVIAESKAGELLNPDTHFVEYEIYRLMTEYQAYDAIDELYPLVSRRKLPDTLTEMQIEVLTDCIDGSTWVGCMDGNCTEQLIGRHYAAGCRLQKKLEAAYGIKCDFPNH